MAELRWMYKKQRFWIWCPRLFFKEAYFIFLVWQQSWMCIHWGNVEWKKEWLKDKRYSRVRAFLRGEGNSS